MKKLLSQLASLKLAVIIIVALATISAVGTFYEAKYDAYVAQKLVYQSIYMYIILGLLCITLIAVMVDRWPWKRRHIGFIFAHIGIIILLLGAWLTQKYGIDGSMVFNIGGSSKYITLPDQELVVYSAFAPPNYALLYQQPTDFFLKTPTAKAPLKVSLGSDELLVLDYYHYALETIHFGATSQTQNGPALRFLIQNAVMTSDQWVHIPRGKVQIERNLGPARVIFTTTKFKPTKQENLIVLQIMEDESGKDPIFYTIYSKRQKAPLRSGRASPGDVVETGWKMGAQLRFLKMIPHATQVIEFEKINQPAPSSTSAVKISFKGQEHWLGINRILNLYLDDRVYLVSYQNKRLNLDLDLKLTQFSVGRYQGTQRASSYESVLEVPDLGLVNISMNQPMKYKGFTFYQSSFTEDDQGKPTASILSVNWDPGRPLKYLGSFLIVLGAIILFYFKRLIAKTAKKKGHGKASAIPKEL